MPRLTSRGGERWARGRCAACAGTEFWYLARYCLAFGPGPAGVPPLLAPLLPPGWRKCHDDETGLPYFFNEADGETAWEIPQWCATCAVPRPPTKTGAG